MSDVEVKQRKEHLIKGLKRLGIYHTSDGRKIEDCSLYTLEWTNISVRYGLANESY
ncbi:hypothetical protein [Oceanobacillus sp. J11TS1]|uniref:hypothetical protein n=1 Tax=Oceanobacillus sp. J11TS1 TaxID=2807191 RepID=UPI001B2265B3|nr:hypothetical protein [Oceanobacillus sp. J11TS1]GIO25360.1 hypothetical protein J11TS1_39410 [Oceanobacillus sp. J11TS1]